MDVVSCIWGWEIVLLIYDCGSSRHKGLWLALSALYAKYDHVTGLIHQLPSNDLVATEEDMNNSF